MENERTMSFFLPPISPVRDVQGRMLKAATIVPYCGITLRRVWELITASQRLKELTEAVRRAADESVQAYREQKQHTLPYVTPSGVFDKRSGDCLQSPSGLVVVDVDHLDSEEEAQRLRDLLFDDPFLRAELVFVSPGGRGVKAFVPYRRTPGHTPAADAGNGVYWAMQYVQAMYAPATDGGRSDKGVDTSGKDLVRACFLNHDPGARMRTPVAE